jgi:hypothetical protein
MSFFSSPKPPVFLGIRWVADAPDFDPHVLPGLGDRDLGVEANSTTKAPFVLWPKNGGFMGITLW